MNTATAAGGARPALPAVLWPLLFGNFVIGTGVMAVAGALNEISTSLQVSVATAGQLISVGAVLMCVGAPLFAAEDEVVVVDKNGVPPDGGASSAIWEDPSAVPARRPD